MDMIDLEWEQMQREIREKNDLEDTLEDQKKEIEELKKEIENLKEDIKYLDGTYGY